MDKIFELIKADKLRLEALKSVYQLNLPECYLAAGFVRNMVWDHLHNKTNPTPLNDVDVIYFDANEGDENAYLKYESKLSSLMPQLNWQVRNQAIMHKRNGDNAYQSTLDAMHYWPEKETAVAIRQVNDDDFECLSAFGFDSLFNLHVTHNPKRERAIFEKRIKSKKWLVKWPMLKIMDDSETIVVR